MVVRRQNAKVDRLCEDGPYNRAMAALFLVGARRPWDTREWYRQCSTYKRIIPNTGFIDTR